MFRKVLSACTALIFLGLVVASLLEAPTPVFITLAAFGLAGVAAVYHTTGSLPAGPKTVQNEQAPLEAVVSGMEDGLLVLDAAGTILYRNRSAAKLFEFNADPVGLKLWEAIRHPELEEQARRTLDEKGASHASFVENQRRVSLVITPMRKGGGVVVARDTTETHRYDELRREFVANVSHELRTPLTLIRGYIETLQEGAWKDNRQAPMFLDTIHKNVRRLTTLVEDLLHLSHLDSGGQIVRAQRVEIRSLLDRIRDSFAPLADRKNQKFQVSGEGTITGDPDLLERALGNLAENAIKYTPDGGHVSLAAEADEGVTRFLVRDTGIGISEKDLPRVFERFYRVDKSRSRELGGTGLGLAIVKHIAQLHGGSVSVESLAGEGSTFTFELPKG